MKKNLVILSLLVMSLMIGVVSAVDVDFISPETDGEHISGDYLIEWENGDFEIGWLKYKEGVCGSASGNLLAQITGEGTHEWDTTELEDGQYCIKITGTLSIFGDINVTIDNEDPTITYFLITQNGNEKDEKTKVDFEVKDNIGVDEWEIDWVMEPLIQKRNTNMKIMENTKLF